MGKFKCRPQLNTVYAVAMVFFLFLALSLRFDFYYDLNDDVLIKDIVSGAYIGTPNAHSIQMLYPLSLIISLLYRVIPAFPWQGIFLCACHGVCFFLIAGRSLSFVEKEMSKMFLLLTEASLIMTLFLYEAVFVQYTVTAALLAACACFLVFTSEKKEDVRAFLKEQAIPVVLVVLAFNLRSEMLLLMSPFIAFTGIVKWASEKEVFAKETIKKYLSLIGVILVGAVVSLLIDALAYSGKDWKEFRDFFNARTQVYDYTWYPEYEEAEEFYRDLGVTPAKVTLIDNYNFGLDESIDADMLWSIADYADAAKIKAPLSVRLKEAMIDYKWRTFHEQDAPYNFFVLTGYAMVIALALVFKDKSVVWKLPVLAAFRTVPWMYVILAKRVPPRISHPLYYTELIILGAWMLSYCRQNKEAAGTDEKRYKGRNRSLATLMILLYAFSRIVSSGMLQKAEEEQTRRAEVNAVMRQFEEYTEAHPEDYFYMDVYSTVDFSEKMFVNVDNSQKNYDILGGWASGSPLQKDATVPYREEAFSRAELLLQDNFYYVCEEGSDTEYLKEFYSGHGMVVELTREESFTTDTKTLVVYRIEAVGTRVN